MQQVELKQSFETWKEYLQGKKQESIDSNSIAGVFYALFWEMGTYESYVAICVDNPKSLLATLLFGNLTAYNYIQVQALRIRRLCEPLQANDTGKDTSVYSLRGLVDEIKVQRKAGLLTRENICGVYGIPVSKDEIARQFAEALPPGRDSFSADSIVAGNIHVMLDKICDNNGLLKKSVLSQLDTRLLVDKNAQLSEIVYFVDKNIAHSSSTQSREQLGKSLALRTAEMKKVIRDITEVFYFCYMFVLQADHAGMVPVGWQDQLENLTAKECEITYKVFGAIEKECELLKKNGYELLGI